MSNAGHPKPVLCDNLAGGMGWGGRVRMGNTCTPMVDSCECKAKTTTIL